MDLAWPTTAIWIRLGPSACKGWELIGSGSSACGTSRPLLVAQISLFIGSSTNLTAFCLDRRGLLPLVLVLFFEEATLGSEGDSEHGNDAAGEVKRDWMKSLNAMSNGGGFLNRQSKYHPHCWKWIGAHVFIIAGVNMKSWLLISKLFGKKTCILKMVFLGKKNVSKVLINDHAYNLNKERLHVRGIVLVSVVISTQLYE